ncbi:MULTISPECIES: mannitol dehydrogenase family protein [unclassified Sphingomonas]|uniref:mannitol dehydrogenase family protein n=1 Tax=unclassified Sphingomonas TaxID=196159 RepID=UPI0006FF47C7|nr:MULTISPECIES: mannitol dehydrogenase family protein [unclassified Sphingomonas]KQM24492.1 mannitol dehydrogenase [Sphingomonas sp. Leaf9]KQM42151.1 mannitol dehydrogenase [Sphingomonas sp. Leaf11]
MRLSDATLGALPPEVARPDYDRASLTPGIVHIGPGAFHRAHQAAYVDDILRRDPRWAISAVALNSTGVADALAPQDGLYTLALLGAETRHRVIGSIVELLTASRRDAILSRIAAPTTRLVTTTVTEKGYHLDAHGALDLEHPAIVRELTGADPSTLSGWLVAGLAARRAAGGGAITLLACDNLADNGARFRRSIRDLAAARDPDLAAWIDDHVRFPSTMVDSITPASDDALRASIRAATGLDDAWPIQREAFSQWVIEDDFAGDRPPFDLAGAQFTRDVRGFENAKLRLLNGAHSTLAYLGILMGLATVRDAMACAPLAAFAERLMREDIAPSIAPPAEMDLSAYIADVLARFANPAIAHQLAQIAWDGSQKLPYRLCDMIRDARAAGRPVARLAVPIAAWFRFLDHRKATGETLVDPRADALLALAGNVRALLAMGEVFGDLGTDATFVAAVERAYAALAPGGDLAAALA